MLAGLYLWRLGFVPIHATADECRRALVPLEMILRGDWLSQTINGEPYLNKPPLFAWLVAATYTLFGEVSPFTARLPVVLSILASGLLIFYTIRSQVSAGVGALTAIAFMTCWRTLTLDSMLSLVEHPLALLTYASFALIYILGERKRFGLLFVTSYALTALVFLLKGLPALLHQGLALLVYFGSAGQWRRLAGPAHALGIIGMTGILALYYVPFFGHNELTVADVYGRLVSESTKRFSYDRPADVFLVLLDFPPDFIKHFLPWTLLVVALFVRPVRQAVWAHPFLRYHLLLFAAIIPFYWAAAFKNPHYFYFLLPSFFAVVVFAWQQLAASASMVRAAGSLIPVLLWTMAGGVLYLLFHEDAGIDFSHAPVIAGIVGGFATLGWLSRRRLEPLWALAGGLILVRLVFNVFILPTRVADQMPYVRHARAVDELVADDSLAFCTVYPAGYLDAITFPLETLRRSIVPVTDTVFPDRYYLMDSISAVRTGGKILLRFPSDYADNLQWYRGEMMLVRTTRPAIIPARVSPP